MPYDNKITSFKNFKIKSVVRLRERSGRDESGLMIIEGIKEVLRAKEAQISFQELYLSNELIKQDKHQEIIRSITKKSENIFYVSKEVFAKISFGHRSEGVLAICAQPRYSLQDLKLSKYPLLLIVESLEKPGNLGAILRTCDGAGIDGVIVCDKVADIYNPNVIRSSIGTIFSVPVVQSTGTEAIFFLKKKNIKICATFLDGKEDYVKINMQAGLAIAVGSEQKGLSDLWRSAADHLIRIPMKGKADSLNVSVAAAIVLYEAIRQRNT